MRVPPLLLLCSFAALVRPEGDESPDLSDSTTALEDLASSTRTHTPTPTPEAVDFEDGVASVDRDTILVLQSGVIQNATGDGLTLASLTIGDNSAAVAVLADRLEITSALFLRSNVTLGPVQGAISIGPHVNLTFSVPRTVTSPLFFPTLDLGNVSAGHVGVPVQFRLAVGGQRVGFTGGDAHPIVTGRSFGSLCAQWRDQAAKYIRNDGTILRCQRVYDEEGRSVGTWLMLKGKDAEPAATRAPIPTPTVTPEPSQAAMNQAISIVVAFSTIIVVLMVVLLVKKTNAEESAEARRAELGF
jgi:hypothetical protein